MQTLLVVVRQADEGSLLVRLLVWLFFWPFLLTLALQVPLSDRVPGALAARLRFLLGQLAIAKRAS